MCTSNPCCKLAAWNCRSILSKTGELTHFICKHNVDIVALSETLLKKKHNITASGYNVYRNDEGRGVALIVKNNITHYPVRLPAMKSLSAVGIKARLGNLEVLILSVYQSPSKLISRTDITDILRLHPHVLLIGDLNSKHVAWNCPCNNRNGVTLLDLSINMNFAILAPREPTFYPDRILARPSIIDIGIAVNIPYVCTVQSVTELSSDHNPVIFCFTERVEKNPTKQIFDYKNADWKKFRTCLDNELDVNPAITNIHDIEKLAISFEQHILNSAKKSIPVINYQQKARRLPSYLVILISIKNKVKRAYYKHRYSWLKRTLRKYVSLISKLLIFHNNSEWNHSLSKATPQDGSLYRFAKNIKSQSRFIPPILKLCDLDPKDAPPNYFAYSDIDKANVLATHFGKVHARNNDLGVPSFTKAVIKNNKTFLKPVVGKHVGVNLSFSERNYTI